MPATVRRCRRRYSQVGEPAGVPAPAAGAADSVRRTGMLSTSRATSGPGSATSRKASRQGSRPCAAAGSHGPRVPSASTMAPLQAMPTPAPRITDSVKMPLATARLRSGTASGSSP